MPGVVVLMRLAAGAQVADVPEPALLRRHGGRVLARTAAPGRLGPDRIAEEEGGGAEALVLLGFPTAEDARRWRADPDWTAPAGLAALLVLPAEAASVAPRAPLGASRQRRAR